MASRDVILTTLHRVRFEYVADFLESLRRTRYRGEVVMFVSAMDGEEQAKLRREGITVIPFRFRGPHIKQRLARFWIAWRWFFQSGAPQGAKEWLAHEVFHLFYLRHLLYLQFLRERGASYARVFLTDSRDVYFQADPFSWNLPDGIHLFLEDGSNKVGQEMSHVHCVRNQFGQAVLDEVGDKTISCAGTVLGDTRSIMKYLAEMVSLTMQARSLRDVGGDQGIHNYLLYKKDRLPEIIVHDNGAGPVLTLGVMRPEAIRLNAQGFVVNNTGTLMPVLHQYDRFPDLQKTLQDHLHRPLPENENKTPRLN